MPRRGKETQVRLRRYLAFPSDVLVHPFSSLYPLIELSPQASFDPLLKDALCGRGNELVLGEEKFKSDRPCTAKGEPHLDSI